MAKVCKGYVGIACVDGNCPKALAEEYAKRYMDVIKSCDECIYYRGCEDCAFEGDSFCVNYKGEEK